ncbi:MFS transporter [Nocardioides speluncae]|uniref:MFS transporter n=1 Tax=Nocardioides speluncae TaxID=2670337 RepID=UPI00197D3358|nr:MFS transporter [Nocardioides speluncae]
MSILETIAPKRMGSGFRWLLGSTWVSNAGDGLALAAGPLLVASETRSPMLVALAALLQQLPWLLFGLYAGVLADRLNRRALVIAMDLARVGLVGLLCLSIATGWVSIGVVLVALFLIGTAEVFADSATGPLMPMLVGKADLGIGTARMEAGYLTMNQMIGPPIGAALFAAGMAWPFALQVVCGLAAVVLISRIRLPAAKGERKPIHVRRDIADGLRWTWGNGPVRTLTLALLTFNVMLGLGMSILVLYATERLGLGPVGFGLMMTSMAVGGILGTTGYGIFERRLGVLRILRWGLVLETMCHLGFALTTWEWVAFSLMFVMGVHSFVWSTTSKSVRMRAVPTEFQGRVGSLYVVSALGTMALGQLAGGVIASH